ncbi:MAG: cytochrome c [Acidimicrobiia bacterium]
MLVSLTRLGSWIADRISLGLIASLGVAALAGACGGAVAESSPATTPAPLTSPGHDLYSNYCARCHGAALEGKGANPAIDAVRLASLGDQRLRMTIESGKGQMPGFRFSSSETDALIAYLRQPT